jgi:ABC-type transporter Mla subunit MlaD
MASPEYSAFRAGGCVTQGEARVRECCAQFAYFRRATQQSLAEAIDEVSTQLKEAKQHIVDQLDEFAAASSKPLEEASKKSGDTIQQLNARIAEALDNAVKHISREAEELSKSTALIIKSFDAIVSKLAALKTPDHIIEIKLSPMIQGLSRAVNNFGKHAEIQAKAVDANLKQTQLLADALQVLLADVRARAATRESHHTAGRPGLAPGDVGGTNSWDEE